MPLALPNRLNAIILASVQYYTVRDFFSLFTSIRRHESNLVRSRANNVQVTRLEPVIVYLNDLTGRIIVSDSKSPRFRRPPRAIRKEIVRCPVKIHFSRRRCLAFCVYILGSPGRHKVSIT